MAHPLAKLFLVSLLVGVPAGAPADALADDGQDTLTVIEQTRGGRHWIDAKTAPPKSAQQSQKCFQIEAGLRIELVAAEPLVMDPVAIAFDDRGRMFVVEFGDYPVGPATEGDPPLSRIVMLEDTDGDGRMDRRHLFADRLTFANSLMAFKGGMLACAQTEILFLKDTDGDNRADVREVLFAGFAPAHPQMQISNPRWGPDNWVYLNYGPGKVSGNVSGKGAAQRAALPRKTPRKEFRFHPQTMAFEPASGLGQYGNTIDHFGRRFFCTNRNPIITAPISYRQLRRNPFVPIAKDQYDVGPAGGAARVYPLVKMKSNYLSHAGTHTSACGTTAYQGDLLGAKFAGSLFVCEPIGHLVTRSIIRPTGATLTADRAEPKRDFLASTDTWFRPASLANGPSGALYLADMYRLWVEHPKFLPEEIAQRIDWRAGDDRGRIWRIVRDDTVHNDKTIEPRQFVRPNSTAQLVGMLADPNGWRRQLAQRLLVERQDKSIEGEVRRLLGHENSEFARLHALWTLDGLGELLPSDVAHCLSDRNSAVRQHAVRLSAQFLDWNDVLLRKLAPLVKDSDRAVRLEVALALGESNSPQATEMLIRIALSDGDEPWMATALLTSVKERSGLVLTGVVNAGEAARTDLVRQLATVVGTRGDLAELASLLETIGSSNQPGVWWQTSALSGLAEGLPRHSGRLGRTSLAALLAKPPQQLASFVGPVQAIMTRIALVAIDADSVVVDRVAAIELLGHQPFDQAAATFQKLLVNTQPVEVQQACIAAMQRQSSDGAAAMVIERWQTLGPSLRGPALELMLRRTTATRQMLAAMSRGAISPAVVDIDQRVRLLRHRDKEIKSLAEKVLGGAVSANRRKVAEQYKGALTMKSSAQAGLAVFERTCEKCHRINGRGYEVGPDISDVRNRSRDALLRDILDPNQKLEPRFSDYVVATHDGRIFSGLMVSETTDSVVLRQAEGKQQVIARSQIEEMRATGKSLMPEGVEKEITLQQMADLLEFLRRAAD